LTDHLSSAVLNALADGELSADQLAAANQHLAACLQCTSSALAQSLLKSTTSRAGHRYTPPPDLRDRLAHLASQQASQPQPLPSQTALPTRRFSAYGWTTAFALLLLCVSIFLVQHNAQRTQYAALITEVSDQHIATLAANAPPQVISSDRHTVKPWFQGKIPFSFNLPLDLSADTTLDGANLTYLRSQPTAQLLFSIGKHHVSVFIQQKSAAPSRSSNSITDHAGFHITSFTTPDLEVVAVSDADPTRLTDLVSRIQQAQ
jgi:anti-sigma factor RsiW